MGEEEIRPQRAAAHPRSNAHAAHSFAADRTHQKSHAHKHFAATPENWPLINQPDVAKTQHSRIPDVASNQPHIARNHCRHGRATLDWRRSYSASRLLDSRLLPALPLSLTASLRIAHQLFATRAADRAHALFTTFFTQLICFRLPLSTIHVDALPPPKPTISHEFSGGPCPR